MKLFWVIYDANGVFNFFDTIKAFNHARKHVHGLMEGDTYAVDSFYAENVKDCWTWEDLNKWKDGYYEP